MIIRLPDRSRAGEVREEPASLLDLFVTLLSLAEIGLPEDFESGRNLLSPGFRGSTATLHAEYYYPLQVLDAYTKQRPGASQKALAPHLRRLRSIERDGLRLIWASDGRHELYDLRTDPEEGENRIGASSHEMQASQLAEALASWVATHGGDTPLPAGDARSRGSFDGVDPESARQLKSLGYLGADGENDATR